MRRLPIRFGRWLTLALAFGLVALAGADEPGSLDSRVPGQGTARLSLTIEGSEARVEWLAPAATLIGFDRAPRTDDEREILRLARGNLAAGEAMIRFNTRAACRLQDARVETELSGVTPATGEDSSSKPVGKGPARLGARYRFRCEQPQDLDSAALGLFNGFPALERVLVRYVTPDGQGAAELTRGNPVVSFVPF
ncbi:ZrgA family zinc uptake protein [Thiocystis violacea]|uniref:ZrgA family zinc uptake protein n=1 Tax=Thiocystis violacea TaxID=13725 RepID=UPI001907108D